MELFCNGSTEVITSWQICKFHSHISHGQQQILNMEPNTTLERWTTSEAQWKDLQQQPRNVDRRYLLNKHDRYLDHETRVQKFCFPTSETKKRKWSPVQVYWGQVLRFLIQLSMDAILVPMSKGKPATMHILLLCRLKAQVLWLPFWDLHIWCKMRTERPDQNIMLPSTSHKWSQRAWYDNMINFEEK
jgi:hypothetical protein